MSRQIAWLGVGCLLLALTAGVSRPGEAGEKPGADARGKPAAAENTVIVQFRDGSRIRLELKGGGVEVQTAYGVLKVPPEQIREIEFGVHIEKDIQEKVEALIADLGSDEFGKREKAAKGLVGHGADAYPLLEKAKEGSDLEKLQRITEAMKQIRDRVPSRLLERQPKDTVHAREFTIVGTITNPAIQGSTRYFGDVEVRLSQIVSIRWVQGAGERDLKLAAADYGSAADKWFDTEVEVERGAQLTVTAAGQVDLWPQGQGQYLAAPEGYGTVYAPYQQKYPAEVCKSGSLLGRIGADGRPFLIGPRYTGEVGETGKLYLHIVPSPWNNASSGEYNVSVRVGAVSD